MNNQKRDEEKPVKAITNFLPTEDVKNSDHFIGMYFFLYRQASALYITCQEELVEELQ